MRSRSGITLICACALLLATGCRPYRTREFAADPQPVKFENWRIYVHVRVLAANPSPTNHFYAIDALAWTLPGDATRGNTDDFRPTVYDASLDSLRLWHMEGTNAVELSLPPPSHGAGDHPNRLLQLGYTYHDGFEISASVRELRAEVTMTFRHRDTGKTETKVFPLKMFKRERTKIAPLLD